MLYYLKLGVIIYASLLILLFFYQRNLMYFPDKSKPRLVENAEIAVVKTSDGLDLEGWYFPPKGSDMPILVYFHGNGGNIIHRFFKIRAYLRLGYGVLLAEYRGYGGNPGYPNEEGFYADARAYMDWIKKEKAPSGIILYGESIGTGTAVQMATEYKVEGLVLEAPFTSLTDVASGVYFFVPVRLMIKDRFENDKKIDKINTPLLVMHGQKDDVIPYVYARRLYDKAVEPKTFIDFPEGNHNNVYDFAAADFVIKFVDQIHGQKRN